MTDCCDDKSCEVEALQKRLDGLFRAALEKPERRFEHEFRLALLAERSAGQRRGAGRGLGGADYPDELAGYYHRDGYFRHNPAIVIWSDEQGVCTDAAIGAAAQW